MKIEKVELRRIRLELVAPFRTSFGTETERDVLLVRVIGSGRRGVGRVCGPVGAGVLGRVRRGGGRRHPGPHVASSRLLWSTRPHIWLRRPWPASRVTPWRKRRWKWPSSTPSCGSRASHWVLTSVRCTAGAVWRLGRHHGARLDELLDAVGGYLDRGIRAREAQDRARVGRRAGPGGPRALRRRPVTAGRRQHRLHPGGRPTPGPPRPVRPPADRTTIARRRPRRTRRSGHAGCAPPSAWTSRSPRPEPRQTPSSGGRARSSTSRPAGSAATWRPGGYTTCAQPTVCRSGAAACSRPDWAGLPMSRWRPSRTSPCQGTSRRRTATGGRTSRRLSSSTAAIWWCRPGPGLGVTPDPDALAEVTTSVERFSWGSG